MDFTQLGSQQRDDFERDGFLILPGALPREMVERLLVVADRLHAEGMRAEGLNERGFWQIRNCLPEDDVFLELLDWPATVPLIVQLLNHNIQLITSHLVIRPPIPRDGIRRTAAPAGIGTAAQVRTIWVWHSRACSSRSPTG